MLIIFAGLPGTGKTTISKMLTQKIHATYLRIDTIESTLADKYLNRESINDAGYMIASRIAEENLKSGNTVILDSVNPLEMTRRIYRKAAENACVPFLEIELVCSDSVEHRYRIENRKSDLSGLRLPTWEDVAHRHYEPFLTQVLTYDTGVLSAQDIVQQIIKEINTIKVHDARNL